MARTNSDGALDPPVATADQTIDGILEKAGRTHTPLRHTFVQQGSREDPEPGPLKSFVTNGDQRALLLYLLAMGKASAGPWDTALAAAVWAPRAGHRATRDCNCRFHHFQGMEAT